MVLPAPAPPQAGGATMANDNPQAMLLNGDNPAGDISAGGFGGSDQKCPDADERVDGLPLDRELHDSHGGPPDVPLPRPKRRKPRAKADRGLPPDEELARLAEQYLRRQR